MSLTVCIPDLIEQGKIAGPRTAELQKRYDELLQQYQLEGLSLPVAEAKATKNTLDLLERDVIHKKYAALLQLKKQTAWLDEMRLNGVDGALDPQYARRKLEGIDKATDVIRNRFFSTLDNIVVNHRNNVAGQVRNKDGLTNMGRELFGENTGDAQAKQFAQAVKDVMEVARQRYNAAGGNIGKLDEYGLPQRHDSARVRAVSFEEWAQHPSIQNVRVRDLENGDFAKGLRRETILRDIYESIRTDGANKAKPGQMFAGSMANKRSDPRSLHFDNFDDWMAYQDRFGASDNIYQIFSSHLSAMARDIALMEGLGPNPSASIRFQKDWIEKSIGQKGTEKQRKKKKNLVDAIQNTYDELTGANKSAGDERIALAFSTIRSFQVASKLGGATLSAVTDFSTVIKTAHYNNLPVMKTMGRYVKLWTPGGKEDMKLATRLGLITDDWIGLSSSASRFTGEEFQGEIGRRVADGVIRSSGLARHTRHGQWAFGMEFISHLTQMKDRSFSNLDPALQRQMQRYDIGESDWNAYRNTSAIMERGADWIMPLDVKGKSGERIMQMILNETDHAVIVPDIRTRTQMNSLFKPGTWLGEIGKSTLLFKSFPWAIYNIHGRRMLEQEGAFNKTKYGVSLGLMMVAGGALSAQLKLLASGKDPQPMDDEKFLAKAVVQSGGLGLAGDLLYNSENSFGGGMAMTLLGPVAQSTNNIANATVGNLGRQAGVFEGDANYTRDIAKTIEREIPGRNLWYTRAAYDRLFADRIKELTDPNAAQSFRRMERRAEKEGTEYYARPGQGLEDIRLPDFENITSDN